MLGTPSQNLIPIKEIHDNVLILDDGSYRAVILTNSINLSLKSEDEQIAILSQFQNFLNSLDFNIQISCRSRRADIEPYINLLNDSLKSANNELIKLQIVEYIEYIRTFTESTNIMEKEFFVVIPYIPAIIGNNSFNKNNPESMANFEKNKRLLSQRVDVVVSGLSRCGLKSELLDTENLIALYYELYNPGVESEAITT